nr:UTP--glucose-1-phosphate uridylyltransferase [Caldilineaceae bacterium]
LSYMVQTLFDRLLPQTEVAAGGSQNLHELLAAQGFDRTQHEQIRADMRSGRIGLAQNRLPVSSRIEDVRGGDVLEFEQLSDQERTRLEALGRAVLAEGAVAVVSLAGGAGSRWTQGAGVVKALNPFARLGGKHVNFIEVHLAKSRRASRLAGVALPHLLTTSYLTQGPLAEFLAREQNYGYEGPLRLSPGRSVGLRLVPMARDLRFAWEELPQQLLDEQAQKVQDSLRNALLGWARAAGEGNDYTDNVPAQCLHPVGHWFEVPNLLRNGVLAQLLQERPQLRYLLLHNIDTLGADVASEVGAGLLGYHVEQGAAMTAEVITRRIEDRGGGLARVDGHLRLLEGLAMPREELEFALSYYNSATYWIDLDQLLTVFGLVRDDLRDESKVVAAVRTLAGRMPTYITLKEVKRRWGKGQEDIFPVAQFEKLWGDMTALPELSCRFVAVPRRRGQQLKAVDQLDGWLRDGSAAYVESLCDW